jgi:hypothetical protein
LRSIFATTAKRADKSTHLDLLSSRNLNGHRLAVPTSSHCKHFNQIRLSAALSAPEDRRPRAEKREHDNRAKRHDIQRIHDYGVASVNEICDNGYNFKLEI